MNSMPNPSGPSSSMTVLPAAVRRRRRPLALVRPAFGLRSALGLALAAVVGAGTAVVAAPSSIPTAPTAVPDTATVNRDQTNASVDDSDLQLAATAIVDQAISSGALTSEPDTLSTQPAAALMSAVYATLQQARTADPSLDPVDTRSLMGPVPYNLAHQIHVSYGHRHITLTHTLRRFQHEVFVGVARGFGLDRQHDHVLPARPQPAARSGRRARRCRISGHPAAAVRMGVPPPAEPPSCPPPCCNRTCPAWN